MTIDNVASGAAGLNQTAQANQTGQTPLKGHHGHHPHRGGDQVELSDLAAQLSAQASASDPTKLARLQAAYQSGTYNVPPSQIAAGVIEDALAG